MESNSRMKSIIDELNSILPSKNKHAVIESRAMHIIASATHLIALIRESYDAEVAEDLVRRFHKSIISENEKKFSRKIKELKDNK